MFKDNILKVTRHGSVAVCMLALAACAEHPQSSYNQPVKSSYNQPNSCGGSAEVQIFSISPNSGPNSGGTEIQITGSNFTDGLVIKVGLGDCGSIHVHSSSLVTCITPEHWGYAMRYTSPYTTFIAIRSPNGGEAYLSNAFTYLPDESHSSNHGRGQSRGNGRQDHGRQDHGTTGVLSEQEKFQLAKTNLCNALEITDVPSATDSQIQRAFRRKALQMHPDRNPHRREEATAQFQELSNLRDEYMTKRASHGSDW